MDAKAKTREGSGLLGEVQFEEIGNEKLRCIQTGHELLAKDVDSYRDSKGCRLALIDRALAQKKSPLSFFEQSPVCKGKLVCRLTGDTINKTEEHIWKHMNGKKFMNKLAQKEAEKKGENKSEEKKTGHAKKKKSSQKVVKVSDCPDSGKADLESASIIKSDNDAVSEEPDFWTPPVGDRWDFDDGGDRWASSSDSETNDEFAEKMEDAEKASSDEEWILSKDSSIDNVTVRTKRMSIEAVGPSSFASQKKKKKRSPEEKS